MSPQLYLNTETQRHRVFSMYRTIEEEKSPWLCVSVFQIKKGLKFIIMNKGKLFFTLLSLLAALAVNAQEFHFTGHAEGVCNSHMFTTVEGFYNDTIKIDSNGNFEFTAKVAMLLALRRKTSSNTSTAP